MLIYRHPLGRTLLVALILSAAVTIISLCLAQRAHSEEVYGIERGSEAYHRVVDANGNPADPRPRNWCGWWLRHQLGVADRAYNRARKWASFGTRASGPAPGVIAVWPHHVGIVTAVPGPGRIILKSGNDDHAVREREHSSRGVIAWRWPSGMAMRFSSTSSY
jgi:hypothetical protein